MSNCYMCKTVFVFGDVVIDTPMHGVMGGSHLLCPKCYTNHGFQGGSLKAFAGSASQPLPTPTLGNPATVTTTSGTSLTITGSSVRPQYIPIDKPVPAKATSFKLGYRGATVFELKPDGAITADWKAIMELKDRFLAGDAEGIQPSTLAMAAALWFARNT